MASRVEMANRALQKLGQTRIISLSEDSVAARAANAAFEPVKLAELRAHPWSFAIKRASLAASATEPIFGKQNSFPLPADFLRLLTQDPEENPNDLDRNIEGRSILTNETAPLEIRYIYDVTDPNEMDSLFREAFSTKLAIELCEEITQSNSKKADLKDDYKMIIAMAKKTNAIEKTAEEAPEDTWITTRL